MDDSQTYFDPQTLSKLKGLELKARLIVEGYVSGLHKSPFHGFSAEFAEHREYAPGDDLRYVDWKVYGKSDRFYLKQYEEETNFNCYLLLDTSESMQFKSAGAAVSKLEYARYVAAALAYLVVRQQDAVGLATFDRSVTNFVRSSSKAAQLNQLFHIMGQSPTDAESSMGPIFHDVAERIKKRGLVVILSDLFDDPESILLGLKHFQHRRHDVSILQIIDPAEQDFPFDEPTLFKGLEGLPEQMTDPRSLRKAYQSEFQSFLNGLGRGFRELQMDHAIIRTDTPLDVALSTMLQRRMRYRR